MADNFRKNAGIKKANEITNYTPHQIAELQKCAKDPIYFMEQYAQIQHPTKGSVRFKLHEYQKEMVKAMLENRYTILLASRQVGKSTVSSIFLLWFAMFKFDQTILITSNKNDTAMEMIYKIQFAYEHLPNWLKPGVDGTWSKHSIEFDNKSRILSTATTANSGRGLSISLLFCDEFAFVDDLIQEDFWTSVSPTLATGGSCIIASTPNSDNDVYARLWRGANSGTNGFIPIHIAWNRPPGRDEKFKQREISKIGELKWRRDYGCEFISEAITLVDAITIVDLENRIIQENIQSFMLRDITFWKQLQPNTTYIVGVDPATGESLSDYSVIEVFEFPSLEQVAEFRNKEYGSSQLYVVLKNLLKHIHRFSNEVYFSTEKNGIGEGLIALYQSDENPPDAEFVSEEGKNRHGFNTTDKIKIRMALSLQELIVSNKIKFHSMQIVEELKNYVRKGPSYRGKVGSTDDCIAALLIIMRIVHEMATYDIDAYEKLNSYDEEDWSNEEYNERDPDYAPGGFAF